MKAYPEEQGFELDPARASLMPPEKALSSSEPGASPVSLREADRARIRPLALPLRPAIEACKRIFMPSCELRERQVAIPSAGDGMLSCTVYDCACYGVEPTLESSLEDLQR